MVKKIALIAAVAAAVMLLAKKVPAVGALLK